MFLSSSSCTSEGGVAPTSSLKLLAGRLAFAAIYQPKIDIRTCNKPCKLPDLARIVQRSILKSGHVPSYTIENHGQLCDFWKRIKKLRDKQLKK